MNVVVIGTGYVGLNTAVALAYLNHSVIGIDVSPSKVESLNKGIPTISEEGLPELLASLSGSPNLSFTTSYKPISSADVVFITVGTPSNPDGSANLSYIYSAVDSIIEQLKFSKLDHSLTIVIKSTVPIGVNSAIESSIRESLQFLSNKNLHFCSNPEFLREGTALLDTFYPDRIIIGSNDSVSFSTLKELYKHLINRDFTKPNFISSINIEELKEVPVLCTDPLSSEMIKYASNCFLALKISYANEISNLARALGANMKDISKGMGFDHRIAPYFLNHGLGWGGSCFPKDSLALLSIAKEYNLSLPITQASVDVNNSRIPTLISILLSKLHTLYGKKITLFGITFKPKTDDVRNSLPIDLAKELVRRGAIVTLTDPVGLPNALSIYHDEGFLFNDDPYISTKNADALIISTDWQLYKDLDYKQVTSNMKNKIIFDARNALYSKKEELIESGIEYLSF
jgi:UDPglucose 6-dehydrogenase